MRSPRSIIPVVRKGIILFLFNYHLLNVYDSLDVYVWICEWVCSLLVFESTLALIGLVEENKMICVDN